MANYKVVYDPKNPPAPKAIYWPFKGSNNWGWIEFWPANYGPHGKVSYGNPHQFGGPNTFMIPIMPHEVDTYNKKPLEFYKNNPKFNRRRK